MTAENVKVIVRCRPMNKRERELKCKSVVTMSRCNALQLTNPNDRNCPPKQFTFDSVYDVNSATENLYNDICYPLIESVLEGYNSTIFAYGQTGCGKSFTMQGPCEIAKIEDSNIQILNIENIQNETNVNNSLRGIIPRAFEHIFEAISVATDVKYLALVSYLEIYNEQIRDLLMPPEKLNSSMSALGLKEIPNGGVVVQGLTTHPIHNIQECERLLRIGSKNRIIGATLMNQNSSRSHSIFTISIEQISNSGATNSRSSVLENAPTEQQIKKGKLNLVDLAGSERQAKTGATGDRLKEATKINLSLSALGNVISALVDGKSKHIPYRDSKLTRLLQDSLGGNTRTLMIACISPADNNYDETLSTLRYANRAKNIHNKPTINEDPKDAMLRQYQEEIQKLRQLLETNRLNSSGKEIDDPHPEPFDNKISTLNGHDDVDEPMKSTSTFDRPLETAMDAERNRVIQEYQEEMTKLKNAHESEKIEKELLLNEMKELKAQYQNNLDKINSKMEAEETASMKKMVSKEEILSRLQTLKASMIGGENANDEKLKEKRKKKKIAAEKRLNTLATVLSRVEQDEDRELLQNQYTDITQELNLKTEALRKYRHKVKALDREISDIQSEFEIERTDYLETVRRHERTIKLLQQINDKLVPQLRNESNYCNLQNIKEQAEWIDDLQKWKLPEIIVTRTKFPPTGKEWSTGSTTSHSSSSRNSNSDPSSPASPVLIDSLKELKIQKLEKSEKEDIAGSYFKPRRATQLLSQSQHQEVNRAINLARNRSSYDRNDHNHLTSNFLSASLSTNQMFNHQNWNGYSNHTNGLSNFWLNGNGHSSPELNRKPIRLEALPTIEKRRKSKLNTLDLI